MGDPKMFDKWIVWAMVMMVGLVSFTVAEVDPSCLDPLEPCVQFLNNTDTPNAACCTPMRQMVKNDMSCLCLLLLTPDALEYLDSSFDEASRVVKFCVPSVDLDVCMVPEDNKDNGDNEGDEDNKDNGKIGKRKNDAKRLTLTGFTSLVMFLIVLVF